MAAPSRQRCVICESTPMREKRRDLSLGRNREDWTDVEEKRGCKDQQTDRMEAAALTPGDRLLRHIVGILDELMRRSDRVAFPSVFYWNIRISSILDIRTRKIATTAIAIRYLWSVCQIDRCIRYCRNLKSICQMTKISLDNVDAKESSFICNCLHLYWPLWCRNHSGNNNNNK